MTGLYHFFRNTLRGRLILSVAAVHAVMMTLFIVDLTVRQREMLLQRQTEQAIALSQALATTAAEWIAADDISGLQELVEAQRPYPEILFVMLADHEGRVMADLDKTRRGQFLLDLPAKAARVVISEKPSLVDVATPAMMAGRHVGWVRVGIGQAEAKDKLGTIIRDGIIYALAAILIGSLIAWFMGLAITRRLYAIQSTIDAVRTGSSQSRSPLEGEDEAAAMSREFNSMLDALAKRDEDLQASEERYRSLIMKVQTAIVLHDRDGKVLKCNPLAAQMLGFTEDELTGKVLTDPSFRFLREDGSVMSVADYPVSQVLATQQPVRGLVAGIQRESVAEPSWILVNAEPEFDAAWKIQQVIVSFVDITERKKTELEQERLVTVIEQSRETVVITDLSGNIIYVNPAFETSSGYTRQEVLGQNPRMLRSGKHDAAFYQQLWTTILRGDVWRGHLINLRKDGTLYEEDTIISPIRDANGRVINFAAVKRDVTREMQLEQQVRQGQKMEAVGRLAGGVAHDFNNILQAILGYCEILIAGTQEEDKRKQDLLEIRKSAQRASNLTRQLLTFGRRQVISPTVLDLNALITNADKMLSRLIGEDIQFVRHLSADLKRVQADAGQLEQVVVNLAVNARDAMPMGGLLTISTYNVTFSKKDLPAVHDAQPGDFVALAVSDTGAGMSADVQAHIFEPFFSTKGPGKGTGLGLAVIYGIVKQHSGWIHVESQLGKGSTFTVYLPACAETGPVVPLAAEAASTPPRGRGEKILLTEDDAMVRNLAIRVLKDAGYNVTATENAEDAEKVFSADPDHFDMVFSDVVLPGQSGVDLAKKIRKVKPGMALLLTSGYTDDRARWGTIQEQGFDFLQKPYSSGALLRTIREILDSRRG